MSRDAVQISTEFKVRYSMGGSHVHCTLYSRQIGQTTWQNCGSFVIGVEAQLSLYKLMPGAQFEEKE